MATILVASEGDECSQGDAHVPPQGAGTYSISHSPMDQTFVYINNELVVVDLQMYIAHGIARCASSTTLMYINGKAAVRDGDSVTHHHPTYGVDVINQSFVYSD